MGAGQEVRERRLSSEGTVWWRDIFPTLWASGVGIGTVGIWMGWWGGPATMELKFLLGAVWVGTSVLLALFGRTLHDVWLGEDSLLVSGKGGDSEIPLQDVVGFSESRGQKVKTIKIKLRPGSPLAPAVRFVPPLRFQAPFSEHPIIQEIKEQKQLLAGESGSHRIPS